MAKRLWNAAYVLVNVLLVILVIGRVVGAISELVFGIGVIGAVIVVLLEVRYSH
jgi:hypothetical protein